MSAFRALAVASAAAFGLAAFSTAALAQKKYDPGASDTTIKIGNIMPYSGPASAYGVIGRTEAAYFKMINDRGGINGRKIDFISYDDAYSPPKAVEQVRRLVESDEVLLVFSAIGICLWLIRGNVVIELPTRLTEAFAAFNASLRRLIRRPVPA